MMYLIGAIGLLSALFFLAKDRGKLKLPERVIVVAIGISFAVLMISIYTANSYYYLCYNGLMLAAVLGVLFLSIKEKKEYLVVLLSIIWAIGFCLGMLNFSYHYEFLALKLLVVMPLSFYLIFKKNFAFFDKLWAGLCLITLCFEVYNSYFI